MAPVSRTTMGDQEKRMNDSNEHPSPIPINNDFSLDESGAGDSSTNPLQVYRSFFAEYSITAEFNLLAKQNIPGIYCIPTSRDPYEWLGVLFLRQGIYQGAILRFSLKLPSDFPETEVAPSLTFEIPVFHPNIDPDSGALNVIRGFPTWRSGIHHVHQILVYMQRCFFAIECTEPVLNGEAAKLYKDDTEKFCERAVDSVRKSREVVYDPPQSADAHAIRFTPWDQTIHEPIRARILKSAKTSSIQASPGSASSLSWSTSSVNSSAPPRNGSGGRSAGLSFFDDKTFGVMSQEKTWPTTPTTSSSSFTNVSDLVSGDQSKVQKPSKSSSKSKLALP